MAETGIELAKEKAREFFSTLNPESDILFFVSSNEARAIETANIYRRVVSEMGFKVIKHENVRDELAKNIGDGYIRTLDSLSLGHGSPFVASVFTPMSQQLEINWCAVDDDMRDKWERARKIISADDQGSWGANFHKHAERVKSIFPEIKSPNEEHDKKFKNLQRLVKFARRKTGNKDDQKNVKILAFGHENYMGIALENAFDDPEIKNCETIVFDKL